MAVVLMLLVISGIMLAFMFDRQGNQSLTVKREMDSYTFPHISRGIQEAVEAWIRSNGNNSIAAALDENGRAFDLIVDGGQVVHVYFRDAQGTALADFAGLSGDQLDQALDIIENLRRNEGRHAGMHVRREGPVAVSVNTASEAVLKAVIGSTLDPLQTSALISEINDARDGDSIDREALEQAINKADVPTANRPKVQGLLAVEPVLWQVVAEAAVPQNVYPAPPAIRYGGLAIITPTAAGGRNRSAALQRSSSMISWENLSDPQ
jgi:hypothetical protein